MTTKNTPPEADEPVREITIMAPKKVRCGATQCRYCDQLSYDGSRCNAYGKPVKRSKGGKVLRCHDCLANQRGRR